MKTTQKHNVSSHEKVIKIALSLGQNKEAVQSRLNNGTPRYRTR